MARPTRYISTQEPIDEEERELMDPESWDWERAEAHPGTKHEGVELRILFSSDIFPTLAALADDRGVTPAELAHQIVVERLVNELPLPHGVPRGLGESS